MRVGGWRGFPLYWTGRAASQFGDEITILAVPWLVAEATASPFAVGALQAFSLLPVILFGFLLGALSDRRSRRRSMIETDVLRFVFLASLPIAVVIGVGTSITHVLIVAFIAGGCRSLFEASSHAFLVDLVPAKDIVVANAHMSFTEGIAIVAGPTVAGVLIATIGSSGAIVVDAATFLLSAATIALIYPVRERLEQTGRSLRAAARDGLHFMKDHRQVRALTIVLSLANFGSGIFGGLIVLYFQQTLALEGWQAGLAYAANGFGVVVASVLSVRVSRRLGFGRTVIIGLISTTAGVALFSSATSSTWVVSAAGGMAVLGFGVTLSVIASTSLRQQVIPGELLGRVTASYRIFVSGSMAVGALAGGIIGEFAGVRAALLVGVLVYAFVAAFVFWTPLNEADPVGVSPSA